MKYFYRGEFSKGLDSVTTMGVTFVGRAQVDVVDAAACNWFDGHPDYVRVAELVPDHPVKRHTQRRAEPKPLPKPAKKPRKKRSPAKS